MTWRIQAVYERGVLRPLEPLSLSEHQLVTVTVSDRQPEEDTFFQYLEEQADESMTLEEVRAGLSKIPGSMAEEFRMERDER